jgi:hypothetical protein
MIKGLRSTCLFAAVCLLLMPGPAHAGIWRYIEELSGPGPFNSLKKLPPGEFRLGCWKNQDYYDGSSTFATTPSTANHFQKMAFVPMLHMPCMRGGKPGKFSRVSLNVEWSYLRTAGGDGKVVYDDQKQRPEELFALEAFLVWQPVLGLEVGAGMGAFRFYTEKDGVWRLGMEPMRVDLRPFDAFLPKTRKYMDPVFWRIVRSFGVRQSFVFLPGTLKASDFGGSSGFSADNDYLKSIELIFDCSALLRRLAH